MQNEKDLAWDKYSEEYIIQALANLGQRVGIKGDGIAYKSFTFNDILTSHQSFSSENYIGYIEYIANTDDINIEDRPLSKFKANFGIAKKSDLNDITNIDTSISINDILFFPTDLSFTIPINGVEKYSKNSICSNDGNELTFILAGKFIGYEDDEADNAVLLYYKFDIASNKLKYFAKLFKFYEEGNNSKYYCLISAKNNDYDSNILSDEYTMTINILNTNNIDNQYSIIKDNFANLFKYSNYEDPSKIPFNILNTEFININNLESYNDNININYDSNSPIAIMLNTDLFCNNNGYPSNEIKLIIDTDSNQLIAQDSLEYNNIITLYANEYKLNLDEELYFVNENINKLYYNIFQYYNEKFYLNNRPAFVKRILSKLYERVSGFTYENASRLYVPLDYEFHYICNNNNELQIYYSNNIYVTFVDIDKLDLEEFWINNSNLIYDYKVVDKVKTYNFEINYNKHIDTLINTINIKEIYTMPYINASYNWSINDADSKIQAIGKDAGNPNIIVIYNNDKNELSDSYKVLNAVANKKYVTGADYQLKWFNVNNALFDNIFDVDIKCCAYIPKVNKINFEYFKNSMILGISDLKCLENEDYIYNYKGSYIITLWTLEEVKNDTYEFRCITHENQDYALALGSSVNLLNETDDSSVGNLNDQDLILLKSIINTVAQERLAINNNNWLILKNKQAEEYISNTTDLYKNDLNAIVQYNDSVTLKSNHIIHSQNKRYIDNIDNLSITNSLYPKYSIITSKNVSNEFITKLKKSKTAVPSKTRETRVIVNGQQITNIESLIEELRAGLIEEQELKQIVIEEANTTASRYNEYIFNSNIPTFDFKEIFNRNVNVLNRVNIISLDHTGRAYNSYIGTSFNESTKNVLHIGTSKININLGSDTLLSEIDKTKFNTHDTISIDFDNIKLNASNIITKINPLNQYSNNGIIYNMMNIDLIGNCMPENVSSLLNPNVVQNISSWNDNADGIFAEFSTNDNEALSTTEVEYIVIENINNSRNKQYFVLDNINENNTDVDWGLRYDFERISPYAPASDAGLMGGSNSTRINSNSKYFIFTNSNGYNVGWGTEYLLAPLDNMRHVIDVNYLNDGKAKIDNIEKHELDPLSTNPNADQIPKYPIFIGGVNCQGSLYTRQDAHKFYGAQITKGNNIIADYVPMRDGNVGCIYDKINKKTIYSITNNNIQIGPDVHTSSYYISLNNIMQKYFNISLKDYIGNVHIFYDGIEYSININDNKKYTDTNIISIGRGSDSETVKDKIYLLNIKDIPVYELPNNNLYCAAKLNVMYYTVKQGANGNTHIYLYISFNK